MARVPYSIEVRAPNGDPISGASITLTTRPGGAAVTHWSAETGGTSSTAAFTTDANGRAARWVDSGSYNAVISKAGLTSATRAFDAVRGDGVELIANNTVGTPQFLDGAVTAAKITANAITTPKLTDTQVTEAKLANDAVSARTIVAGAVTNAKIADDAVGTAEILDRSVGATEISSGAVGGGAVGTNELAALAVTTSKIQNTAVLRTHIAPMAVTGVKLGANSVDEFAVGSAVLPEHVHNEVIPVGVLETYAGATAPSPEWMIANGAAISRTTYAVLFAYLGTTFGAGDGSTTFNIPDMRGRTPVGIGTHASVNAAGDKDAIAANVRGPKHGHTVGSLGISTNGSHTHIYGRGNTTNCNICCGDGPDHPYGPNTLADTTGGGGHSHTLSGWTGDMSDPNRPGSGNNDMLFHQVVNYIIKVL